jgi:hypothetical protein
MNRQKMALAILLVIFAISIAYSFVRQPPRRTVEKLKYAPRMKGVSLQIPGRSPDDKKLRLDLLDREPPRFSGFRRNLFRPIFPDLSKLPLVAARAVNLPPVPPPPPPPPKTPAQLAMEDMSRYTFLGYIQKGNHKTIFLTRDNEIILAKKGDKIVGKYEVTTISDEALTINLLQNGEQIVIPLMENRALARAPMPAPGQFPAGMRN